MQRRRHRLANWHVLRLSGIALLAMFLSEQTALAQTAARPTSTNEPGAGELNAGPPAELTETSKPPGVSSRELPRVDGKGKRGTQSEEPPVLPFLKPIAEPFQALYRSGVLLRGMLSNDFQGNLTGGLRRGTANGGTVIFGADLLLDRLIGLPGGQFHLLFADTYGTTLQDEIGNYIKSQGWYYPFQRFELAQLAYEQELFGGKVNIYGGRTNATAMFARPTYGCAFISGSQCPYILPLFTGGFSGFPYVTWGGRIKATPIDHVYVQSGVFSVDPNRRNVSGFDLGLETATGVVAAFEAGYESSFQDDEHPRHFKIGGWYNNAPSLDPRLNANRESRAVSPGPPLMNTFDRGGLYALADQVIYRPDRSRRNLAVFASYAMPFDDREVLTMQGSVGVLFTGPFASRASDTTGIMFTWLIFTEAQAQYMNELLAKNGSTSFLERDQYSIEVNYAFRVFPGLTLTPNAEYIIHPDTSQRPDATFAPGNAFIAGIRAAFSFGQLFGLPSAIAR